MRITMHFSLRNLADPSKRLSSLPTMCRQNFLPQPCAMLFKEGSDTDRPSQHMPALCTDAANDNEVERMFDVDEYQKGGSILRMLWDYMSSAGYSSARLPGPGSSGHSADVGCLLLQLSLMLSILFLLFWQGCRHISACRTIG